MGFINPIEESLSTNQDSMEWEIDFCSAGVERYSYMFLFLWVSDWIEIIV